MLLASRATAGSTPRCIHCGAEGRYIDLNASWRPSCSHFSSDLTTLARLEADVKNARTALSVARGLLRRFRTFTPRGSNG